MQAVSTDQLFLSDAQLARADARDAKAKADQKPDVASGWPIVLPSKPLALQIVEDDAFVAENGFVCRRIDLKTGSSRGVYKGHAGPVTSLAVQSFRNRAGERRSFLFTGSWDKSIKVWDVETRILLSTLSAHSDFVKSLHILRSMNVLVSGSTDRDIRLWPLDAITETWDWSLIQREHARRTAERAERKAPSAQTGEAAAEADIANLELGDRQSARPEPLFDPIECPQPLRSHIRPVEVLASHALLADVSPDVPVDYDDNAPPAAVDPSGAQVLFAGDTMGALKVWLLQPSASGIKISLRASHRMHETGIYAITFGDPSASSTSVPIWTASADRSVALSLVDLSRSSIAKSAPIASLLRIRHPDYVKSVLDVQTGFRHLLLSNPHLLASGLQFDRPWLVSGSTDEEIRIFDLQALDVEDLVVPGKVPKPEKVVDLTKSRGPAEDPSAGALQGILSGHWHEVSALSLWVPSKPTAKQEGDAKSPEIKPGQLWLVSAALDGTIRRWELSEVARRFTKAKRAEKEGSAGVTVQPVPAPDGGAKSAAGGMELTAEEEAELAELMGDD